MSKPTRWVERVEAMQHDGSAASINRIVKWLGEGYQRRRRQGRGWMGDASIGSSRQAKTVWKGDWVVRHKDGAIRVMSPDGFTARYEREGASE